MQEEDCPNVVPMEEHTLEGVSLRIEDVTTMVRRDILKETVPSWGSNAVGILRDQTWQEDSRFVGEIVELLL